MSDYELLPSEVLEYSMGFCQYGPLFYSAWILGNPIITDAVPTAAVQFNSEGTAVNYLFNDKFWNSLNKTERMFVFAHEILHVFLNHGARSTDLSELANVAMDLVINHMLLEKFGFNRNDMPHLKNELCFVDTVFENEPVETGRSFEFYYDLLKQTAPVVHIKLILSNSGGIGQGIKEFLEDQLNRQLPNEVKKEILEKLKDQLNSRGTDVGNIILNMDPNESVKKSRRWETLISKVLNKFLAESFVERWMPRNRRIQHLNSDIFLPSTVEDDDIDKARPKLWVFLDTSGSCHSSSKRFWKALRSIPLDKFDMEAFGFDMRIYKIDIKQPKFQGFGGTSFSIIENYIKQNAKRYPDLVFVITDGDGDFVKSTHPKRWHWFLTYSGNTSCIPKDSHVHNLEKFENSDGNLNPDPFGLTP